VEHWLGNLCLIVKSTSIVELAMGAIVIFTGITTLTYVFDALTFVFDRIHNRFKKYYDPKPSKKQMIIDFCLGAFSAILPSIMIKYALKLSDFSSLFNVTRSAQTPAPNAFADLFKVIGTMPMPTPAPTPAPAPKAQPQAATNDLADFFKVLNDILPPPKPVATPAPVAPVKQAPVAAPVPTSANVVKQSAPCMIELPQNTRLCPINNFSNPATKLVSDNFSVYTQNVINACLTCPMRVLYSNIPFNVMNATTKAQTYEPVISQNKQSNEYVLTLPAGTPVTIHPTIDKVGLVHRLEADQSFYIMSSTQIMIPSGCTLYLRNDATNSKLTTAVSMSCTIMPINDNDVVPVNIKCTSDNGSDNGSQCNHPQPSQNVVMPVNEEVNKQLNQLVTDMLSMAVSTIDKAQTQAQDDSNIETH